MQHLLQVQKDAARHTQIILQYKDCDTPWIGWPVKSSILKYVTHYNFSSQTNISNVNSRGSHLPSLSEGWHLVFNRTFWNISGWDKRRGVEFPWYSMVFSWVNYNANCPPYLHNIRKHHNIPTFNIIRTKHGILTEHRRLFRCVKTWQTQTRTSVLQCKRPASDVLLTPYIEYKVLVHS